MNASESIQQKIFEEISGTLLSYSGKFEKKFMRNWKKSHKQMLESFIQIQNNCLKTLSEVTRSEFQPIQIWQEVESSIQKIEEWTDSLNSLNALYSSETFWQDWRDAFRKALADIPESAEIIVDENDWIPAPRDTFRIRIWKGFNKNRHRIRKRANGMANRSRAIFKRSPVELKSKTRTFNVHHFLQYHYEAPGAKLVFSAWQQFLQKTAIQFSEIHETTEESIFALLFLEEFTDIFSAKMQEVFVRKVRALQEKIASQHSIVSTFESHASEISAVFKKGIAELNDQIQFEFDFAGTSILPVSGFREQKSDEAWQRMQSKFEESKTQWAKHLNGETEDWHKDLELSRLQARITQIFIQMMNAFQNKIHNQILPTFEEPYQMLLGSLNKFKEINVKEEAELKSDILAENRVTLRTLRREKLPHTIDSVVHAQLMKTLENYISRVKHATEDLSDQHSIFRHQDLKKRPPDFHFVEIPLKDIVINEIFPGIEKKYEDFTEDIQLRQEKIVRDLSEVDQIVEFNLETALELIKTDADKETLGKAHTVVQEGLERAKNQLSQLIEQIYQIANLSQENLLQTTLDFENQIQELVDNEAIMAIQFRVAKAKTREKFRAYYTKAYNTAKAALPNLLKLTLNFFKKVQTSYLRIRKMAGLAPAPPDVEAQLTQFLGETRSKLTALPFVYQRLFRFEPLMDERFFTGREKEMEALENVFGQWKRGEYATTAIIGEKGSGRTSILNFAIKDVFKPHQNFTINLDKTIKTEEDLCRSLNSIFKKEDVHSIDELEHAIISQGNKVVCIVENLHHLFLRTVDGFDAMERFLLFISNTHKNIFWLITCGLYAWRYVDKVIHVSHYFQHVIFLEELTIDTIENVILKRHRVSGFKLLFETPEEVGKTRRFNKLSSEEEQQEYLKEMFFNQLNKLALGNITVAILFWLCAIVEIRKDSLVISPVIEFDPSFLQQLPAEDLFTFAAFLQHESLSAEQHARVFNQSLQKSLAAINRLKNKGILAETPHGFQLHYLMYRPVVRTLKINNILH